MKADIIESNVGHDEQGQQAEKKPLIEVKNVRKVYRMGDEKVIALNNVSLDIYKGEIVCLLGTSGSGKSTFLNMVAGLEKPSRGEIIIGGVPIHKLNEANVTLFRQKNIGFIFQAYHLMAMLTALENVSMPLIFQGADRKSRDIQAKKMLKAVGLAGYEKRKPTQMSGGQQQRVGIARALVGKPKIIFADEPTGNLDTHTTLEVMNLIVDMVRKNNQTLIIVTHDRSIAEYADKVVTIRDGDIVSIEMQTPYETRSSSQGAVKSATDGQESPEPDLKTDDRVAPESESVDSETVQAQLEDKNVKENAESVEHTNDKRSMRSSKGTKSFFKKNTSRKEKKKGRQETNNGQSTEESIEDEQI